MKFPESVWRKKINIPKFNTLMEDTNVDVVIVGGGLTGITTAYLLSKEGMKVALLEADKLVNGTTGHTTAKITAQHDVIYDELIGHFGESKARLYYEANTAAIHFIEQTIKKEQIDCDFSRQDAWLYATTESSARKLENEFQAYQKLHIEGELEQHIPLDIDVSNALKMKNQAQFHPLCYLAQLVQVIVDAGGLIFENTVAVNVENNGQQATVLTRNGHRVTGNHIISCSHFPFYEGMGFYSTRMYAERSYVLACKTKNEYPGGMYLSVDQPNRSLRSAKIDGETMVLIGGEGHKAGQGNDFIQHYKELKLFGEKVMDIQKVAYQWSTQDLITLDKVPYIGFLTSSQQNILIATGYKKWGMTNGTAAAQLLCDLVLKRQNPYEELYSPSRFYADPSLKHFFIENMDAVKHLIKGKIEVCDKRVEDLANDQGAVVSVNGERKGAYRDMEGTLHMVDTTCTHIGCEVNWNDGDRTWDCPCHGSRFSYRGDVLEGPAEKPLQQNDYDMLDALIGEDSGY